MGGEEGGTEEQGQGAGMRTRWTEVMGRGRGGRRCPEKLRKAEEEVKQSRGKRMIEIRDGKLQLK